MIDEMILQEYDIDRRILKEAELRIKEVLDYSADDHNIFTPWQLCFDMLGSVDIRNEHGVLVIGNLEFIFLLKRKIALDNVWFMTPCAVKKKTAIALGVDPKHILKMTYNIKELDVMKFDYVIQNPPYNPKAQWKKFVELGMDLVKDDGKMIIIHPATWRESSKYKKLAEKIKNGISELHIMDYEAFKENKVATKTDWYVWQKGYTGEQEVTYSNGEKAKFDLRMTEWILRIPPDSIPARILKKIISDKHNGLIKKDMGHNLPIHNPNGLYKLCGGANNGTGWTVGNFVLTDVPTEHQFENKVVISYTGKPRAHFFSKDDAIGVSRAIYWLTDNKSLPILINSKMFWKIIGIEIAFWHNGDPTQLSPWILESLNFDGLNVSTEEELYEFYKLTKEEISWINL